MDSIEEFNFKPITEGLGFHNKKKESKDSSSGDKQLNETSSSSVKRIQSLLDKPDDAKLDKKEVPSFQLKSPLPKKEVLPSTSIPEAPTKEVIDDLVKNFKKTKSQDEVKFNIPNKPQVIINPVKPQIDEDGPIPLPWMISPFFVDMLLVLALVLSGLMAILMITKVDLVKMLSENPNDIELWMTFPMILIGMGFIYMSLSRILLGASLGELVFDVNLGTKADQAKPFYSFRVLGRNLISILTGYITLPILSLIMRKDYLGTISGIRLYKKSN